MDSRNQFTKQALMVNKFLKLFLLSDGSADTSAHADINLFIGALDLYVAAQASSTSESTRTENYQKIAGDLRKIRKENIPDTLHDTFNALNNKIAEFIPLADANKAAASTPDTPTDPNNKSAPSANDPSKAHEISELALELQQLTFGRVSSTKVIEVAKRNHQKKAEEAKKKRLGVPASVAAASTAEIPADDLCDETIDLFMKAKAPGISKSTRTKHSQKIAVNLAKIRMNDLSPPYRFVLNDILTEIAEFKPLADAKKTAVATPGTPIDAHNQSAAAANDGSSIHELSDSGMFQLLSQGTASNTEVMDCVNKNRQKKAQSLANRAFDLYESASHKSRSERLIDYKQIMSILGDLEKINLPLPTDVTKEIEILKKQIDRYRYVNKKNIIQSTLEQKLTKKTEAPSSAPKKIKTRKQPTATPAEEVTQVAPKKLTTDEIKAEILKLETIVRPYFITITNNTESPYYPKKEKTQLLLIADLTLFNKIVACAKKQEEDEQHKITEESLATIRRLQTKYGDMAELIQGELNKTEKSKTKRHGVPASAAAKSTKEIPADDEKDVKQTPSATTSDIMKSLERPAGAAAAAAIDIKRPLTFRAGPTTSNKAKSAPAAMVNVAPMKKLNAEKASYFAERAFTNLFILKKIHEKQIDEKSFDIIKNRNERLYLLIMNIVADLLQYQLQGGKFSVTAIEKEEGQLKHMHNFLLKSSHHKTRVAIEETALQFIQQLPHKFAELQPTVHNSDLKTKCEALHKANLFEECFFINKTKLYSVLEAGAAKDLAGSCSDENRIKLINQIMDDYIPQIIYLLNNVSRENNQKATLLIMSCGVWCSMVAQGSPSPEMMGFLKECEKVHENIKLLDKNLGVIRDKAEAVCAAQRAALRAPLTI